MKSNNLKKVLQKARGLLISLCLLIFVFFPLHSANATFLSDLRGTSGFINGVKAQVQDGWRSVTDGIQSSSEKSNKNNSQAKDRTIEALLAQDDSNKAGSKIDKEDFKNNKQDPSILDKTRKSFFSFVGKAQGLFGSVKDTGLKTVSLVGKGMENVGDGSISTVNGLFQPTFDLLKKNPVEKVVTNLESLIGEKQIKTFVQNTLKIAKLSQNTENKDTSVKRLLTPDLSKTLEVAQTNTGGKKRDEKKVFAFSEKLKVKDSISSNGNTETVQVVVRTNTKTESLSDIPIASQSSVPSTSLPTTLSLSDLKVTGIVDFTGAQLKGLPPTVV
ncbi:MAG: hypothetical protein UX10_C0010G0001, partial [Candidatus Magasanikbacteria bacterium GW2011_GWA2_45_39]